MEKSLKEMETAFTKLKEDIDKIKNANKVVYEKIDNEDIDSMSKVNMKIGATKMVSELIKNLN